MSTLIPHGACLLWRPELIWLNVISDALVAIALLSTGFVLASFVWWRRGDIMPLFAIVFSAYAIFVAMCGLSRLLSILTLWVPAYGIEARSRLSRRSCRWASRRDCCGCGRD